MDEFDLKEKKISEFLVNGVKGYLDVMVLIINIVVLSLFAIGTLWNLGVVLDETVWDLLNALSIVILALSINIMSIHMIIGRKRSVLIALLNFFTHGVIFLIFVFVNILLVILLSLNIIALIFCARKSPIIPKFKTKNGFYRLLILIVLILCPILLYFGTSTILITLPAVSNPNFRVSFYCEFYNNDTFTTSHINALESHNSRIFLAINESQIYNDSLATNITKRLNDANISVYAWLLLNQSKGYWAADSNALEFETLVNKCITWATVNSLTFDGIMIDSEPDYQRMESLRSQLGALNIFGALASLRQAATSGEHATAKLKYEEIVNIIQVNSYEAMVVGFPIPIDDLADSDDDLQRLMGVSTMPPYNWNYSSFMVYRTTYKEILKVEFGSYFIYSYAKSIWNLLGNQSSISLSRCGVAPYDVIDELIKDAFIVKNMGFNEVIWWEFRLFDQQFGAAGLSTLLDALAGSQSVSFNYNPMSGYSRLLMSLTDEIGIL